MAVARLPSIESDDPPANSLIAPFLRNRAARRECQPGASVIECQPGASVIEPDASHDASYDSGSCLHGHGRARSHPDSDSSALCGYPASICAIQLRVVAGAGRPLPPAITGLLHLCLRKEINIACRMDGGTGVAFHPAVGWFFPMSDSPPRCLATPLWWWRDGSGNRVVPGRFDWHESLETNESRLRYGRHTRSPHTECRNQ